MSKEIEDKYQRILGRIYATEVGIDKAKALHNDLCDVVERFINKTNDRLTALEHQHEALHHGAPAQNPLLIESCLEDVKDQLDEVENEVEAVASRVERRYSDIIATIENSNQKHHEERQIILRALDKLNTVKEDETPPVQAQKDSEHYACKRCGWRVPLHHQLTTVMRGHAGVVLPCPSCASVRGWDRIGRNRNTVNIPTGTGK